MQHPRTGAKAQHHRHHPWTPKRRLVEPPHVVHFVLGEGSRLVRVARRGGGAGRRVLPAGPDRTANGPGTGRHGAGPDRSLPRSCRARRVLPPGVRGAGQGLRGGGPAALGSHRAGPVGRAGRRPAGRRAGAEGSGVPAGLRPIRPRSDPEPSVACRHRRRGWTGRRAGRIGRRRALRRKVLRRPGAPRRRPPRCIGGGRRPPGGHGRRVRRRPAPLLRPTCRCPAGR